MLYAAQAASDSGGAVMERGLAMVSSNWRVPVPSVGVACWLPERAMRAPMKVKNSMSSAPIRKHASKAISCATARRLPLARNTMTDTSHSTGNNRARAGQADRSIFMGSDVGGCGAARCRTTNVAADDRPTFTPGWGALVCQTASP